MSESINKRPVIVGIFILVGLLFLTGGIMIIGNLHSTFQKKLSISTIFGDVNGLQAGNNIWFSGVKVGTVKKTEFYGKSQVKVIMNLNTESREYIREDALVKISTDGLIGNKILVIYGGSSNSKPVKQGDILKNESALSTEDIMVTLQKNNLNLLTLTNNLVEGKGSIGKLLKSEVVYDDLAKTANSLKLASANAQTLITSLSKFGDKLDNEGTLVNELVTDTLVFASLKTTVFKLNRMADTAKVFVDNLKSATSNTNSPAGVILHDEKTAENIKTIINNLAGSSVKLDQDLEAAQHSFLLRGYFKKQAKQKTK